MSKPLAQMNELDCLRAIVLVPPSTGGGGSQSLAQTLAIGNNANGLKIVNLSDPVNPQDAATRAFVLANGGSQTPWTSDIDAAGFILKNLAGGTISIGDASGSKASISSDGSAIFAGGLCYINPTGAVNLLPGEFDEAAFNFCNADGTRKIQFGWVPGLDIISVSDAVSLQLFSVSRTTGNLVTLGSATSTAFIGDGSQLTGLTVPQLGVSPIADGTYTVGLGVTNNGTITTQSGIITAIQQAS